MENPNCNFQKRLEKQDMLHISEGRCSEVGFWGAQAAPRADQECKVGDSSQERVKQSLMKGHEQNPRCYVCARNRTS